MSDAPQFPTPRSSRRDFITRSSALAAAGGLTLNLGLGRFAHGFGLSLQKRKPLLLVEIRQ